MKYVPTQSARCKRGGFTLVEVMIAGCVLTIGLLALSSTSVVIHSLDQANKARGSATSAMHRIMERSKAISARSLADTTDWSNEVTSSMRLGGVIGGVFDVPGLDPWRNNPDIGTILVITDETTTDAELGITLGLPRDLNGDGDAADTDVSSNATLLPIIIRARWSGAGGDREATQAYYLTRM